MYSLAFLLMGVMVMKLPGSEAGVVLTSAADDFCANNIPALAKLARSPRLVDWAGDKMVRLVLGVSWEVKGRLHDVWCLASNIRSLSSRPDDQCIQGASLNWSSTWPQPGRLCRRSDV